MNIKSKLNPNLSPRLSPKHSNDGFSLIEVMISMMIISLTVLMLGIQHTTQMTQQASAARANEGRQGLNELAFSVAGVARQFPLLVDNSYPSHTVMYVGCYDKNLLPINRTDSKAGFKGIFTGTDVKRAEALGAGNGNTDPVCNSALQGFEVHAYQETAGSPDISIAVLSVSPEGGVKSPAKFITKVNLERY
jgi:prepilin-type N-terminal cleavage/methylation domain-containing protein